MIVPDRFGDNSLDVIPVRVWHTESGRMRWLYSYEYCNNNNATDVIRVLSK